MMRRLASLTLATLLSMPSLAMAETPKSVTADLKSAEGATLGAVTVTAAPKGVLLRVMAKGLPAGWHGMHFHEKGDCSDPKFAAAGGHVHEATKVVHGLLNADANDDGDLPNVHVGDDGSLTVELYSTLASLEGGTGAKLADTDGFAVIIHVAADDYTTQPIGGAGARQACAAFK